MSFFFQLSLKQKVLHISENLKAIKAQACAALSSSYFIAWITASRQPSFVTRYSKTVLYYILYSTVCYIDYIRKPTINQYFRWWILLFKYGHRTTISLKISSITISYHFLKVWFWKARVWFHCCRFTSCF